MVLKWVESDDGLFLELVIQQEDMWVSIAAAETDCFVVLELLPLLLKLPKQSTILCMNEFSKTICNAFFTSVSFV